MPQRADGAVVEARQSSPPSPPSASTRKRMKAARQRDTAPEIAIRRLLHARGLRYRVDLRVDPGTRRRADIVFTRARVAVFVDGCFWHGCPDHMTWPKNNAAWWREKIETNRERDRDTTQRLRAAGWTVIRIWEHEDVQRAVARVLGCVR